MGRFLVPGVIDSGIQLASGDGLSGCIEEETRAAVTGGVTTALVLPDAGRRASVDELDEAARRSFCDLGWWIDDDPASLEGMRGASGLVGVLADVDDSGLSPERTARWRELPDLLAVHWCSNEAPPDALLEVARERERSLHLYALTTTTELDWLDPVRHDVALTTTVTVPHLFLSADDPDVADVVAVPPIRTEQERRTLWTAVRRGRLDCVASHHHPDADRGVAATELLLPLMLHAAHTGRISLEQVVDLCCETPAALFGLGSKGRVAKGMDADLVLFSEGHLERVGSDAVLSSGRCPFEGREAASKPDMVFVGGNLVAERGRRVDDRPGGRSLKRDRAA